MTDERWKQVVGHVQDTFELLRHETVDLSQDDGGGVVEILEFVSPAGRIKLERSTKPLMIGKQTVGSRRMGSQATVNYLYSDTEKTHHLTVYRWNDAADNWLEMSPEHGNRLF